MMTSASSLCRSPVPLPFTFEIEMTQKAGYLGSFPVYNHVCDDISRQHGIGFAYNALASCDLNAYVDREYHLANPKQAFHDQLTRRYRHGTYAIKTGLE
jgi:hypothetical protein